MSNPTNAKEKAERRRRKVIALFSDATSAPTVQDAAKILGVSAKTIDRDLKAVRADMTEAEDKLQVYQTLLKKRLPIDERVRLYDEIARQPGNLFARFKALQRIDAIDGIIPDIERLKVERPRDERQFAPMFILPPGTHVDFTVSRTDSVESDIRDITPEADADSSDTN